MIKTRAKTRDIAFPFRMGAGFAGDVNRTHPCTIEPVLIDSASPPAGYGYPVLLDATAVGSGGTQGVRGYITGDTATTAYGIGVRPYPVQQASASNFGAAAIGVGAPPASGVMDVIRSGYIMVNLPAGNGTVQKGSAAFVRVAASSGAHVMGAFEAAADGGNTVSLVGCVFNGIPDANGNVEIAFNI